MEFDDWDDWVSEKTNVPKKKQAVTGEIRETDSGPRDAYMIITDLMNQILDSVDDVDLENAIGIIRQIRKLLDENIFAEEQEHLFDSLKLEIIKPEVLEEVNKAKADLDRLQQEIKAKKVKIAEKIRMILSFKGINEFEKASVELNEAMYLAQSIESEDDIVYLNLLQTDLSASRENFIRTRSQNHINKEIKIIENLLFAKKYTEALEVAKELEGFVQDHDLVDNFDEVKGIVSAAQKKVEEEQELWGRYKFTYDSIEQDLKDKDYVSAIKRCNECIEIAAQLNMGSDRIARLNDLKNVLVSTQSSLESKNAEENARNILDAIRIQTANKEFESAEQNMQSFFEFCIEEQLLQAKFKSDIEEIMQEIADGKKDLKRSMNLYQKTYKEAENDYENRKYLSALENYEKCLRIAQENPKFLKDTSQLEQIIEKVTQDLNEFRNNYTAEQEKVFKTMELMEPLIGKSKDVLPDIVDLSIEEAFGQLPEDVNEMMTSLNKLLEKERVEIKKEITSKNIIRTRSGQVIESEKKTMIEETIDTDTAFLPNDNEIDAPEMNGDGKDENMPGSPIGAIKITTTSTFENTFDDVIDEAILTDTIPYNFEIYEYHMDGIDEIEPKTELTLQGFQYSWKFTDLEPQQKVSIQYNLRRRVSRTVIIPFNDQLKIIKTHSSLEPLKVDGLYNADLEFVNRFELRLRGIVIEDIIPSQYLYNIKFPELIKPKDIETGSSGTLVKWNIIEFDMDQATRHQYRLVEAYKFEELKILTKRESKIAIKLLKQSNRALALDYYKRIAKRLVDYK